MGQYKGDREGGMDNVYAVRTKKTGRTAQAEKAGGTGQVGQNWRVTGKEGKIIGGRNRWVRTGRTSMRNREVGGHG